MELGLGASSSPPGSRTRLVVASQALEIQHLQDLVRSREQEIAETRARHADDRGRANETIQALELKNQRLESQVQLLASKLRELESDKEQQLGEEMTAILSMTQTGRERDALISQLRDELRSCRNQNSSLLQEREIVLEKLVAERNRSGALESQLRAAQHPTSMQPNAGDGARSSGSGSSVSRGVQTADTTLQSSEALAEGGERGVEALRAHIELEQGLLEHHQSCCAAHAANIAELHERLQRRLQQEVRKLQDEQEKYTKLMSSYGTLRVNNSVQSPSPSTPLHAQQHHQQRHLQSGAATGGSAGGFAAGTAAVQRSPASPFFQQQEEEMANLRRRLLDLQARHDGGAGTTSGTLTPIAHASGAPSVASRVSVGATKSASSSVLDRMLMHATAPTPGHR